MSTPYRKKYLAIPEAGAVRRCDVDTLMEAVSEGVLRAFVIADQWPTAGGNTPVSGYVELLPEALLHARTQNRALVDGAKLASEEIVRFEARHEVSLGLTYLLGDEIDAFNVAWRTPADPTAPTSPAPAAEPGERAFRNLERTLGALAHLVANMPGGKYKHGDAPNAKQIAEAAFANLEAKGIPTTGLSTRSLEQRIGDGLKALEEP